MRDGRIVEVMEVVGVEGSRVLVERYLPLHDTVLKRYRVAGGSRRGCASRSLTSLSYSRYYVTGHFGRLNSAHVRTRKNDGNNSKNSLT